MIPSAPIALEGSSTQLHIMSEGEGAEIIASGLVSSLFDVRLGAELILTCIHLRTRLSEATDSIANSYLSGGALHVTGGSTVNLINSSIANFSSAFHGGAVYVEKSSKLVLQQSMISRCKAPMQGGAIRAETSVVLLMHSAIEDCEGGVSANDMLLGKLAGGGISADNSMIVLNSSSISRCSGCSSCERSF